MEKNRDKASQKEVNDITTFIKMSITRAGFSRVIIACSGGVDSTTTLFLAARALGTQRVVVLLLPRTNDALLALDMIGVPQQHRMHIDIHPAVSALVRLVGLGVVRKEEERVRLGNIMARVRMTILFDQAKKKQALVMGTENRSEHLLGYYTRFGDEASDIEPIRHLFKTKVYKLARYLGVPEPILAKAPTAGLWSGQTDEGQFGFSYGDADPILAALYDQGKTVEEVIASGFPKDLVDRVKNWVDRYAFKHQLPYVYSSHNS